jgi:putative SOS response-associated peptidase YedK
MCSRYTIRRDEVRIRLRDKILIYGAVSPSEIRPTDLAPIIVPDDDDFLLVQMRWGWRVPWAKNPHINARSVSLTAERPLLQNIVKTAA